MKAYEGIVESGLLARPASGIPGDRVRSTGMGRAGLPIILACVIITARQ
jgi:hypothetical protein